MGGGPGGGVSGGTRCESQSDRKTFIISMFCEITQTAIKTLQTSHFAHRQTDRPAEGGDKTYWNYKADRLAYS